MESKWRLEYSGERGVVILTADKGLARFLESLGFCLPVPAEEGFARFWTWQEFFPLVLHLLRQKSGEVSLLRGNLARVRSR
jgi:hypothetical protein